jgi:hypothetical protein
MAEEKSTSDQKTKLLNLMRFWLFGTFLIVWVAVTLYIGLFSDRDWWLAIRSGFPIWAIVGALCIVWYFVYKYLLMRRKDGAPQESDKPETTQ